MTKQQTLFNLIEALAIPISRQEFEQNIKALKDEELDDLIHKYSQVKEYEDSINELAVETDPVKAEKLVNEADDVALEEELKLIDQEGEEFKAEVEELETQNEEATGRLQVILDKQNLDNMRADAELVALLDDMLKAAKAE